QCLGSRHPMNDTLHLAPCRVHTQSGIVVAADQLDWLTFGILDYFITANHVCTTKAHFLSRTQTLVLGWRHFLEVSGIDVDLATERNGALPQRLILGMIGQGQSFALPLRVVADGDLERTQHTHGATGSPV